MRLWRSLLRAALVLTLGPATYGAAYPVRQPAGQEIVVEMRDNDFSPAVVRVAPGTTVAWRNAGRNVHTVTADDATWSSNDLVPGACRGPCRVRRIRRLIPRYPRHVA